ncbi:hypothetical protein, partial [Laribacter hongkongensis]|uniref:hypothetical protein n=1 Tax=Laribacter hongkongensis TaxID=168471 RepID=UPI001EFCCB75
ARTPTCVPSPCATTPPCKTPFFALPLTSLPEKTWWILARRLAAELGWGRAEVRACPVHEIPDWLGMFD